MANGSLPGWERMRIEMTEKVNMKQLLIPLALCMAAGQCPDAIAESKAMPAFERLKTLAGSWQGKDEDGQPASATYEVTSGGTVVMEKLTPGKEACMVTMFHLDGDKLMVTHYCARNNQPRMRVENYDPKSNSLEFTYVDATNLLKPEDGHMHGLTMKFPDKDHLIEDWNWKEGDQDAHAIFHFERPAVKSGH